MAKVKSDNLKYGVAKQRRVLMTTDVAWQNLETIGQSMGISRSELIEQFARGTLPGQEGRNPASLQQRMGELSAC